MGELVVANSAGSVGGFHVAFGELTVARRRLTGSCRRAGSSYLRDNPDLQFQQLIDVCGADYPQRELRFDVVYHLLSMTANRRIRVKVETDEDTPVPSFDRQRLLRPPTRFERETFDMYGVFFEGHPDLAPPAH